MKHVDPGALRDGVRYADRWLAFRREFRDMAGVVVAVRHDQELLLSSAYGYAQLEDAVAMTPRHIFRIASHSKTFTATAIMQLVEHGRLRLDDSAATYLPWLPSDVTLRQLLNHAAGIIRDGVDADFWQVQAPFPDRQQLQDITQAGVILEPNERFKYSNIGYGLLGLIVEMASGKPYNDYVNDEIVARLGLSDTGPEVHAGLTDRLVTGYFAGRFGVPRRPVPLVLNTRALSAATGFYSTAEDLSRYAAAHCLGNDTLLSDASKREMQQPYWTIDQAEEQYGLGFSVKQVGERRLIGHGGGFPGQSTRTLIDPAERLVVVVLSNMTGANAAAGPLAETVVRIIDYGLKRARDAQDEQSVPTERFRGRFANLWGVTDIVAFGNRLVALNPEADDPVAHVTELRVHDDTTLRIESTAGYGSPGERISFEFDASGQAISMSSGMTSYPIDVFRQRYTSA